MKSFSEYILDEAVVQKGGYKIPKEHLNMQSPGQAAIDIDGNKIAHSIAISKNDYAIVHGSDVIMYLRNPISQDVMEVVMSKSDFENLKKLK